MRLLTLPAIAIVLALMVAPMAMLLRYSLNIYTPTELMVEAFTLQNYVQVFADPYFRGVLAVTLQVSVVTTLIALLVGLPAGYTLARMSRRWKMWLTLATILPLMVGNVVRSAGWLALLGNSGLFNAVAQWSGLVREPMQLMFNQPAVVGVMVTIVLPLMVMTLASVIEGIPRNVEEAAANLGARPFTAFRRVVLPQAMPGVIAGMSLVFILCMNAYATPVLIGGPRFKMMTPEIYQQFVGLNNWPFGAALAFILLITTLIAVLGASAILQRAISNKR
ncbi:putative spermidine/putrescine transport system permease protein [Variovorax boronicumulans]|uniref:ABC transporter permease n=1 Tax=Variovorax boronicumulans TaxID=436515 RepID=UPI002789CF43|nr:ABC transporter permease [Variovorax boronicumulans]MDP9995141.1 putative spermidine/putrescine transport system permease protein [Variovorax boronicumulans]MDQ0006431.1 putative spermidine/putrescine transport system permease protein [Variovorax boronicumulans]